MNAYLHLLCAMTSFVVTFTSMIYLAGWLTNTIVPFTIDNKPSSWDTLVLLPGSPVINNILLIIVFALQHSLMARRTFKKTVETYFPEDFHKVFYNLATMMAIYAMCFLWAPLPYTIWNVTIPWLKYSILAVRLSVLLLGLNAIGAIDRLSLYGIRQALSRVKNKDPPGRKLITTGYYGMVRHPTMSCVMAALFISPNMGSGQLLFAITMTIYIVVSVLYLEERDLIHQFGSQYEEYKKTTPAFIPSLWRSHKSAND
ncbi:methanethiol S-methyltransferase-like [Dysidea avara]|uniref:methanethiol S-methyltransferase-like n=1 Tax=Dysidea avara TaxID=196820 RepID=UPI00331CA493